MYNIEFYEDSNGYSQLWEFLDDLQKKAGQNKDARMQHQQISYYIELLQENGTRPRKLPNVRSIRRLPKETTGNHGMKRGECYGNMERL